MPLPFPQHNFAPGFIGFGVMGKPVLAYDLRHAPLSSWSPPGPSLDELLARIAHDDT